MPEIPSILTRLLRLHPYEVELLRPRGQATPLSWLLLGVGAIVLAGAVLECRPALTERVGLEADIARLEATLDRTGDGPKPKASVRSGEQDRLAEAAAIVADVRRPWHQLFDQIEAAQQSGGNGVHLVQVAVDPRFSSLQMVAEGRDLGGLVRFTGQMAGNGPIRAMSLTHHEWRDTLGAHVVTASLQGDLDASARPVADAVALPATGGKP